jgi:Cu(I)/Ag(I) efflux system membrane fusion protein
MSTRKQIILSAAILVVALGVVAFRLSSTDAPGAATVQEGHDHAAMMAAAEGQQPVMLDAEGARRIGVTFATVERRQLPIFVSTVGTVAYDETRLATVNPKVDGWVERLHVDFTGAPVHAGQPLMEVYSPALVTAQEELILAVRLLREATEGRPKDNAAELLASARRRLAYWDIPAEEVRRIEESSEPTKTLTMHAPSSGIVVEKNVVEGDRIMPGMTVYRIADLSRVWIEADVFEKDLGVVKEGQGALVFFEAYPGRTFTGRVTYVYPTVSVQDRTAHVRLELPNEDGALRPGMYAEIRVQVPPTDTTLVVPRSALLSTGERALVFVQGPDGALLPREVRPGRTSGRFVQLLGGVNPGDRVVSSAAFLVDAESNLGTMAGDMSGMEGMDTTGGSGGMEGMDHSNRE